MTLAATSATKIVHGAYLEHSHNLGRSHDLVHSVGFSRGGHDATSLATAAILSTTSAVGHGGNYLRGRVPDHGASPRLGR